MLKHLLEKYGIIPSTVIISIFCVLVSMLVTATIWIVLRQPNMQVAILTAFICPSLIAPPLFFFYSRLTVELQKKSKEAQQINEDLEESEEKYRKLFQYSTDFILLHDTEGHVLDVNQKALDQTGFTRDEMLSLRVMDLLPPGSSEKINTLLQEVSTKGVTDFEIVGRTKTGELFPVEVTSSLVELGGEKIVQTVAKDISERKKLEEELLKVQKLESTGILAGGIAHDFNNILTAIMGNISMAKMSVKANGKVFERLANAEKASIRAQNLTHQLLTFSKGGAPIKRSASIIELINDSISFALSGANVKCELCMADNLWPLNIDEGQISQVIQNVVKNAEQAMPDGGVVAISAENTNITSKDLTPLKEGRYVKITIKDQGGGILAKHIPKVFDPYFSIKQEGSGLGLAVSYSIVKNHDGLITAESEYGLGATFNLYLPASEKSPPVKKRAPQKTYKSGEKILIMDDDQAVLNVATNMLNMMGYKTESANDGSEAIMLYDKAQKTGKPFDAVLLDLTIPGGMGGRETLQELSIIDPEVKALVSSGYANDPIMADFEKFGFYGVITKPYNMEKMGEALSKLFV